MSEATSDAERVRRLRSRKCCVPTGLGEARDVAFEAMGQQTLDFSGAVAHIASRIGSETSVAVSGQDPQGNGMVAELTGTLRAIGPDPEDPEWGKRGPAMFGFEGQANAFYLDPDAFVSASASGGFLSVQLTFGTLEVTGPIHRPDWF